MALTFGKPLHGFHDRKKSLTVRSVTGAGGFSAFIYTCVLNVDWDGAPDCYGLDRPGTTDQTGLDPWESRKHHGSLKNARRSADWSKDWVAVYNVTKAEAIRILRQSNLIPAKPARARMSSLRPRKPCSRSFGTIALTPSSAVSRINPGTGISPSFRLRKCRLPSRRATTYPPPVSGIRAKRLGILILILMPSTIPYSVLPALSHVSMGDYGLIIRNKTGDNTTYVCGDSSGAKHGSHKLGECSGAVYLAVGEENEGNFSFIVFPQSGTGKITDTLAAESAVRTRLSLLSVDDADDLANHLASGMAERFKVRMAMAQRGAPMPTIDAVSGA